MCLENTGKTDTSTPKRKTNEIKSISMQEQNIFETDYESTKKYRSRGNAPSGNGRVTTQLSTHPWGTARSSCWKRIEGLFVAIFCAHISMLAPQGSLNTKVSSEEKASRWPHIRSLFLHDFDWNRWFTSLTITVTQLIIRCNFMKIAVRNFVRVSGFEAGLAVFMCTHRVVLASFIFLFFLFCLFSALVHTAMYLSPSPSFVVARQCTLGSSSFYSSYYVRHLLLRPRFWYLALWPRGQFCFLVMMWQVEVVVVKSSASLVSLCAVCRSLEPGEYVRCDRF